MMQNTLYPNPSELFLYLDTNPIEIYSKTQIADLLKTSLDNINKELREAIFNETALHYAAFSLSIENNEVKPLFEGRDENGYFAFPNIQAFDEVKIEQIDQIFLASTSNIVKLHYGHLLICFDKKHNRYYERTIEGYLAIVQLLIEKVILAEGSEKSELDDYINKCIRNLLTIVRASDDTIKNIVLNIIRNPSHDRLFYAFVHYALKYPKIFRPEDLEGIDILILNHVQNETSRLSKIDYFELGLKLDARVNKKSQSWKLFIAKEYEGLSTERDDLATIEFANKASRYYKEAKENVDVDRMAKVYKELSDNKELSTIRSKVDVTDFVVIAQADIESILKQSNEEILKYLITSQSIIPSHSSMYDQSLNQFRNDPMRSIVGNQIFDSNGHVAQHFNSEEEIVDMMIHEVMNFSLNLRYEYFVMQLLYELTGKSGWNADFVVRFLSENTWFGTEIQKPIGSGETIGYKLIDLISPGIKHFFEEINKYWQDNNYIPNFTLSIDSLTMKIEGILREICRSNGIQTFFIRVDEHQREVTKEKDINMLLNEAGLIEILGNDLHFFLVHLLVHRVGSNLRNSIAHSFLIPQEYGKYKLTTLVFIAILRLSNFSFEAT
ncbi:MAG: DUF4209 domain-containing protein [Saprospiraceae bacterium]|nr:DUF4209 domain-containing protein [Saprospiraceae bacterium]